MLPPRTPQEFRGDQTSINHPPHGESAIWTSHRGAPQKVRNRVCLALSQLFALLAERNRAQNIATHPIHLSGTSTPILFNVAAFLEKSDCPPTAPLSATRRTSPKRQLPNSNRAHAELGCVGGAPHTLKTELRRPDHLKQTQLAVALASRDATLSAPAAENCPRRSNEVERGCSLASS